MPWHVARGNPTRLVSLTAIIWSPTLSFPDRAAGPLFSMQARITVGRIDPQPDSTITTPRISPFCFSRCSYKKRKDRAGSAGNGGNRMLYTSCYFVQNVVRVALILPYLFTVLRVREVDEIIVVHLLWIKNITVVFLAEVLRVDPICSQKFLVGHAKRLTNGLCNELGLKLGRGEWKLRRQENAWDSMLSQGKSQNESEVMSNYIIIHFSVRSSTIKDMEIIRISNNYIKWSNKA